jgi:branched-chain amino acid transport system ATP-binding protein
MSLSDQVVVLNFGRVIADGSPDAVRSDAAVVEAYLGRRR